MAQTSEADSPGQYVTPIRRRRERLRRRRLILSVVTSLLLHAVLIPASAPFREEMPLVRNIGYRGERRILPEISVMREPGAAESEVESTAGELSDAAFRVIAIEIVDWAVPEEGPTEIADEQSDDTPGDDVLTRLEMSLPQPRSSEVVITSLVEPEYPASSIAAGVEGVAMFRIHVSTTGQVRRAWLLSSEVDEACNQAAHRAVMHWEFEPYIIGGRPTSILVDQRIRFRLRDAIPEMIDRGASRPGRGE
jgi:TonB family protein